MFTLSVFKDLIQLYPTWHDLKNYLESDEGGKLSICYTYGNNVIIHYNKTVSNMQIKHTKWFRSVIWDTIRNIPISVSTPKSEVEDPLMWESIHNDYSVEDYLEGVTFNAYIEADKSNIDIATRKVFGAVGTYYSNKRFNELILDTLHSKNENYTLDTLKDLCIPIDKSKHSSSFISILLQHPEHIVVEHVKESSLYLLQRGVVNIDGTVDLYEQHETNTVTNTINSIIKPVNTESVKEWFDNISKDKKWDWRGVVIKDSKGNRWRIKSSIYNMIRTLRGNTIRNDERFFKLRSKGLIKTYLTYYPEESNNYWIYEQWIRKATNDLFGLYIAVNKAKTTNYHDIDPIIKPHITALQVQYYNILKPIGKTLAKEHVITYMNTLQAHRLMYMMNFNKHGSSET